MSGKYVFAGLSVVDVSDPTAPARVGTLPISGSAYATGIAVSGTNAYVTDLAGRVHVLDVSDPTAAIETGYLDLGEPAYDVAISGTYAYVVAHGEYCDDEGCTHMQGHLYVLDISGPSCPRLVTSVGRPKASEGILVSGGYAYIAEQSINFYFAYGELTVVDVRNPAAPVDVAWDGDRLGYAPQGIAMMGSAVYVTSPWNLFVYGAFTATPPSQCQ